MTGTYRYFAVLDTESMRNSRSSRLMIALRQETSRVIDHTQSSDDGTPHQTLAASTTGITVFTPTSSSAHLAEIFCLIFAHNVDHVVHNTLALVRGEKTTHQPSNLTLQFPPSGRYTYM